MAWIKRSGVVLLPIILLAALAFFLIRNGRAARANLEERFESRADSGARFIQAFVVDRQRLEYDVAQSRFAGSPIDAGQFDFAVESLGFEAAVLLDGQGRLLAVYPARPEILGSPISETYEHLSTAVAGYTSVSNVVPSAAKGIPVVAFAVPFETGHGRRVFSGAFSLEEGPLGAFLKDMLPLGASAVYLVDARGTIAATSDKVSTKLETLVLVNPRLLRAVEGGAKVGLEEGSFSSELGRARYVARPIIGTPWHLVAEVPEEVLYEPIRNAGRPQWSIFAGLIAAAGLAVHLLGRLDRSTGLLEVQLAEEIRLNNVLEGFSSRVAHDLRHPLNGVLMGISLLRRPKLGPQVQAKLLDNVEEQAVKSSHLVEELFDLARASGTPRRTKVAVSELLRDLADDVDGVKLEVGQIPETIEVDPVSFKQAALNLARNAVKYASINGNANVDVEGHETVEGFVFSFADRGPGLREGRASKIFQPFGQGENVEQPGAGLGLAIVQAMAEAHGGRAWYEDRPGGGAVFKFLISNPRME